MKKIKQLTLVLLSYLPIATVAIAAQSKANEIEGEIQSEKIRNMIKGARFRLLQPEQMLTTIEQARKRYSEVTGLDGELLDRAMVNDLYNLHAAGLIQFNEKLLKAMSRSEHQSN